MSEAGGSGNVTEGMAGADPFADIEFRAPEGPRASIGAAICSHCTHNITAKRGASVARRIALSLLLSAAVIAFAVWLGMTYTGLDVTLRAALYGAAGWAVVQFFVLLAGLGQPPGRRPAARLRLIMAVLVPIVFFGYITSTASAAVPFATFASGEMGRHAVRCGIACLFVGSLVSGGVLLLWRGTDPLTPGLSGALLGLVGGLGGAVATGIACPSHEAWHACFSHGLAVVGLVVMGAALGRRLLTP